MEDATKLYWSFVLKSNIFIEKKTCHMYQMAAKYPIPQKLQIFRKQFLDIFLIGKLSFLILGIV